LSEKPGQSNLNDGVQSAFAGLPNRPMIIGGCPRSGTTLLRTMLHAGREVAIPRETKFVISAWRHRRRFGDLRDPANRRRLARWIFRPKKILDKRLGLNADEAIERLVAAPPTLGAVVATCFEMFAEKEEKHRWGDKRPYYATVMACIWDLFPTAQFINVVRDPRGCVASIRELGWYDGDIVRMVELWERSLKGVDAWRPKLAPDQLLDVRYEDLVLKPEETLRRVARFAGLSEDDTAIDEMLRYQEVQEWRSRRYHANISRPLDPSRLSRWEKGLDGHDVAFVEHATRPLMEQWGYQAATTGIPVPVAQRARLEWQRTRARQARLRLSAMDRLEKLVLYRHPLAAPGPGEAPPHGSAAKSAVA
jgi:Sulfotransferase family